MSKLASTKARGYGGKHAATKRIWAARLKVAGSLPCMDPAPRCSGVILAGSKWHLAHDHNDRSIYLGPAHERCNLWWAAMKANHTKRRRRAIARAAGGSRPW